MKNDIYDMWLLMVAAANESDRKKFEGHQMAFTNMYKRAESKLADPKILDQFHYLIYVKFHGNTWVWKVP